MRIERKITFRPGFSLMEVMVAITIMGMISTLIYSSFSRSLEIPEYLRDIQERYHKVRVAMDRMATEISSTYLSKHTNPNQEDSPKYIFRIKNDTPGDRIDFTAFAHMKMYEDVDESDESEIGYFLESDPEAKDVINLVRREQKRIDKDPGWGGRKQILADDVLGLEIKAWNSIEKDWVDEWDTSQVEQFERLPEMIQIELTILDEFGKEVTFYTKVQIMLRSPIDFTNLQTN